MDNIVHIPVIFWHRGGSDYLKTALRQAEKYMSEVILIGDKDNRSFSMNWHDTDLLPSNKWEEFQSVYENFSLNDAKFEMRCFERYFYVREFCSREQIDRFFLMDSDLLIFDNLNLYFSDAERAFSRTERKTESWSVSPHCGLWSLKDIISFTDYLIRYYRTSVDVLKGKFEEFKRNNTKGGICDMTLLYLWLRENDLPYQNTAETGRYCIDHAISVAHNAIPDEYKTSVLTGCKKIHFMHGKPYLTKRDGTKVRALALHCSGGYKNYMSYLVKEKNWIILFAVRIVKKLSRKM